MSLAQESRDCFVLNHHLMFCMYLKTEQMPRDYPTLPPTELPGIPPWTPDPDEVGKG
jgi:hypothetical protein